MAVFDPDVPEINPHYVDSQPIRPFNLLSSTGEAIKGIGGALSGAIKGSDEIITAYAKDVARQGAIKEQDAYSDALTAGRAAVNLQRLSGSAPAPTEESGTPGEYGILKMKGANEAGPGVSTTEDLYSQPEGPLPDDLKKLPNKLGNLVGGKASGALTETDYYGRLVSLAKDLRSRFPPGYHDYIDQEIAKVTNVHPANAYIRSVMTEINSFLQNKNDETKAIQSQFRELVSKGISGAAEAHDRFLNDGNVSAAEHWINDRMGQYARAQELKLKREEVKDYIGVAKDMALKEQTYYGTMVTNNWIEDFNATLKDKGVQTDADGNFILNADQKEHVVQGIAQKRKQLIDSLRVMADRPDANGNSFTFLIGGPKERNDHINAMVAPFDEAMDRFTNDKSGSLGSTARILKAYENDAVLAALRDPNLGMPLTNMLVIRKTGGDQAAAEWAAFHKVPLALASPFDIQKNIMGSRQPTDPPYTFNHFTTDAEKMKITMPQYYSDMIDLVVGDKGMLGSGADPFKRALLRAVGDQSNLGWLSRVKEDYEDSAGKHHTGRLDAWSKFTSGDFAKEAFRLGGKEAVDYKDWAHVEFTRGLFQPDIQRLKDLAVKSPEAGVPGEYGALTGAAGVKFHWDSDHPENGWTVTHKGMETPPMLKRMGFRRSLDPIGTEIDRVVDHLNRGIVGLVNLNKAAGSDPNKAVLQLFADSGFDLSGKNVEGIPAQMLEAIKNTREKQKAKEEAFRNVK